MNQIGLPLKTPSKQTIIPVFCGGDGNLQGFFTIALTTFIGTETTFPLAEGNVEIETITLPQKVNDGSNYGVNQYMAVVYSDDQLLQRPWIGYSAFVNTNDTGYARSFSMPTQGWFTHYNRGILATNLMVNMAADYTIPPVANPPTVVNGTIRWAASMNLASAQAPCGFFDFNWVNLFQAQTTGIDPVRIDIVSNPVGGIFKSTLVPYQVVAPLGGIQFNTVRIIKLGDAIAGTYVFQYVVTDTKNQQTNCQLTLQLI